MPADARAQNRADRPLQRLHLDICGPFTGAHDGSLYLMQIVDDYSRFVWSRAMINRTALTILAYLEQFVTMAGSPYVCTQARTRWSDEAFDAA